MRGIIIVYDIDTKKLNHTQVMKFHRRLYGYKDYSQFGRYQYRREGLLDKIPHFNPAKSAIVVKERHAKKVVDFIKKFATNIFVREIILTGEDKRRLK